jgi:hypothetical protein
MRVDMFFVINKAPNMMSQNGIIFCMVQLFRFSTPIVIMAMGIAIKMTRITIIVIEQHTSVPSLRKLPLALFLTVLILLKTTVELEMRLELDFFEP